MRHLYHKFVPLFVRRFLHPIAHPALAFVRLHARYNSKGKVVAGPFVGMRFNNKYLDIPKIVGSYEIELHPVFDRLRSRNYKRVVDVGAAEGYYAVGAMLWNSKCSVTAYEANGGYHPSIRYLAKVNGVDARLDLRGVCDDNSLNDLGDDLRGAFLIVDVEGYEKVLLDPNRVPALRTATILVEVHDCFVEGCTEAIVERFRHSHEITPFTSRMREANEYPFYYRLPLSRLMRLAVIEAISDGRTEVNGWLLLEPKN